MDIKIVNRIDDSAGDGVVQVFIDGRKCLELVGSANEDENTIKTLNDLIKLPEIFNMIHKNGQEGDKLKIIMENR